MLNLTGAGTRTSSPWRIISGWSCERIAARFAALNHRGRGAIRSTKPMARRRHLHAILRGFPARGRICSRSACLHSTLADGPTIQRAATRAEAGATLAGALAMCATFAKTTSTPII